MAVISFLGRVVNELSFLRGSLIHQVAITDRGPSLRHYSFCRLEESGHRICEEVFYGNAHCNAEDKECRGIS
jgi:hypothetical protein